MKKILITFTIAIALLGMAEIVQAQTPFVRISTVGNSFNLGTFSFWDDGTSPSVLTVKVESNCLHGPVVASISTLKRIGGSIITPDRILVKTSATNGYVSMAQPVAVSQTTEGPHEIKMNFKVKTNIKDFAGRYSGTLAFTIMPPS
jgi:hypothetical protein